MTTYKTTALDEEYECVYADYSISIFRPGAGLPGRVLPDKVRATRSRGISGIEQSSSRPDIVGGGLGWVGLGCVEQGRGCKLSSINWH